MYAVVEVGGKQYNVKVKDVLDVERQDGEPGKDITLGNVALFSKGAGKIEVGKPYLKNVKVVARIENHLKATKTISYKYRRRKNSHWRKGHRQQITRLVIKEIKSS